MERHSLRSIRLLNQLSERVRYVLTACEPKRLTLTGHVFSSGVDIRRVQERLGHMGMDLCSICNRTGRKMKIFDRVIEVGLPVSVTQRQFFAQGSFIDLNNFDSRALQIRNFIANGERDLPRGE